MPLEVIGAGLGRTGTLSLKVALEELGFGPCYHMIELFGHPEHVELWEAASEGKPVDWEGLFGATGPPRTGLRVRSTGSLCRGIRTRGLSSPCAIQIS